MYKGHSIKIEMVEWKNQKEYSGRLGEIMDHTARRDDRTRVYLTPKRILWETDCAEAKVIGSRRLLEDRKPQISLDAMEPCILCNRGKPASVLLDFGCEIHGGIVIYAWKDSSGKGAGVRVRFGESALEAMSEIGENNATNDHALRDITTQIASMSMTPVGETGFRFVRIDLLEPDQELELKTVKGVLIFKDLQYKGKFHCSDDLLNRIWDTGAYTVHLNIQNYIWDGIKRDRLVWAGDLHPEIMAIKTVFGKEETVEKSLDFVRDEAPLPGWMNDFPAYSMWWAVIQYDWYMYTGDIDYLRGQHEYLKGLEKQMSDAISEKGEDITPETRFLDWPSQQDPGVVDAGLQALHVLAADRMRYLFEQLGDREMAGKCRHDVEKLRRYPADCKQAKQASAMQVLAGMKDAIQANRNLLSRGGAEGMSTFMGYYILTARAMAGDYQGCLDCIREYWGGMLSIGATTFWEDFDVKWLENALPLDAWKAEKGKIDVHGTYGGYCYTGYRHSLCHGWSAGVVTWLSEQILGVQIMEPGCRKIRIAPHLGDLDFAEGSYPTPYGEIRISVCKGADGAVECQVEAPEEIEIVKE